jgi:phosphatidylethanolamine-binding protein (PEBP) family uncharacterized protein
LLQTTFFTVNANNILGDIMKLTSKDFTHNSYIPSEFTIDGRNVSPQLSWTDAPEETESYALAVTDPDAVGGWNHCWSMRFLKRK